MTPVASARTSRNVAAAAAPDVSRLALQKFRKISGEVLRHIVLEYLGIPATLKGAELIRTFLLEIDREHPGLVEQLEREISQHPDMLEHLAGKLILPAQLYQAAIRLAPRMLVHVPDEGFDAELVEIASDLPEEAFGTQDGQFGMRLHDVLCYPGSVGDDRNLSESVRLQEGLPVPDPRTEDALDRVAVLAGLARLPECLAAYNAGRTPLRWLSAEVFSALPHVRDVSRFEHNVVGAIEAAGMVPSFAVPDEALTGPVLEALKRGWGGAGLTRDAKGRKLPALKTKWEMRQMPTARSGPLGRGVDGSRARDASFDELLEEDFVNAFGKELFPSDDMSIERRPVEWHNAPQNVRPSGSSEGSMSSAYLPASSSASWASSATPAVKKWVQHFMLLGTSEQLLQTTYAELGEGAVLVDPDLREWRLFNIESYPPQQVDALIQKHGRDLIRLRIEDVLDSDAAESAAAAEPTAAAKPAAS